MKNGIPEIFSRRSFLALLPPLAGALMMPVCVGAKEHSLEVVYGDNLAPLSYDSGNGMRGILVDILNASLRDRMNVRLEHHGYPWARAQHQVREGARDAFCTNPTGERKRFADFSETPALTINFELFYSLNSPRREEIEAIASVEDLYPFRVVDIAGNSHAMSVFPEGLEVLWASSPENIIQTLAEGRQDVYIGNPLYAMRIIREMQLEKIIGRKPVKIVRPSQYHLGIRKTYPGATELLRRFDQTMLAMQKDGTAAAIRRKYF